MESRDLYPSDDPCSRLEDLLPAYGMGLCDPEEALEVEALLKQCPEMQSELEEYRQLAAYMPYTAEDRTAPQQLLTRILNAAAADEGTSDTAASTHTTYPNGTLSSVSAPTVRSPRLNAQSAGMSLDGASSDRVIPFRSQQQEPTRQPGNNPWRMRALISTTAAAFAVLLLIGANIFWSVQMRERESTLEETQNLLKTVGEDQLIRFELGSVDQASPDARGTVWCNPENTVAVVQAENLPAEAQRQDLKVWLWYGDQREEAGDVWINDQGYGTAVIRASQPMVNYDYVVIAQHIAEIDDHSRPFIRGDLYRRRSPYGKHRGP